MRRMNQIVGMVNLNENGKLIYNALKKEYPKAELLLVTWLDT